MRRRLVGHSKRVNSGVMDKARVCQQQTIKNKVKCTGVGLHSGQPVQMTLKPADADTGILFKRKDLERKGPPGSEWVLARFDQVGDTSLGTSLINKHGNTIGTVEHLMAALKGCGVDNVIVELDGAEVPIMDGSSGPFVFLIECAGVRELPKSRQFIKIKRPISIDDGDRHVSFHPADQFQVDFEIDFNDAVVRSQNLSFAFTEESFKSLVSRARTFGFYEEKEKLHAMGLGQGASLENTIVIDGDRILNEDGLRFDDEFVRHKILDAIGDLHLAGAPILGRFLAKKSGHALTNQLLRKLFDSEDAWEFVDYNNMSSWTDRVFGQDEASENDRQVAFA